MRKYTSVAMLIALSTLSLSMMLCASEPSRLFQSVHAETQEAAVKLPISKDISVKDLEKYAKSSVSINEDEGLKKYEGVPLRVLLNELMPSLNLATMSGWKSIAKNKLVVVVTGDDGYPGVVTALEVAMNKSGDRFLLATQCNGKALETAPQLICKEDEAHTRWVRKVVRFQVASVKE